MATEQEAVEKLNLIATQLETIRAEVQALKDLAANTDISPELQTAIDNVAAAVNVVDSINPDS